jgi:protein gp37
VFVNSMSDLFQERVSDNYVGRVWDVMVAADWHVYQVLTKRAIRMREVVNANFVRTIGVGQPSVARHIWLGVSVEDRKYGVPRIDELRRTKAAVRFLSIEPLLEDLGDDLDLTGIDWVIVGGESGPGARPMDPDWVYSLKQQSADAGVPFFFKQWGGVRKKKAGRSLYGRTWDAMPELRCAPYPGPRAARERRVQLGLEDGQRSLAVIGGSP